MPEPMLAAMLLLVLIWVLAALYNPHVLLGTVRASFDVPPREHIADSSRADYLEHEGMQDSR